MPPSPYQPPSSRDTDDKNDPSKPSYSRQPSLDSLIPQLIRPNSKVLRDTNINPDSWVERDERLIACTGYYPWNAEPPMEIHDKHLITPSSLHYVRSHGAVPRLSWDQHVLVIDGMVEQQVKFTMNELITKFPSVTMAVTLTCNGIRREELNRIKHTKSFPYTIGSTSTCYWTGVRLSDVLSCVKMKSYQNQNIRPQHICMTGADEHAEGHYNISYPLDRAMDPKHDVILAYRMNGHELPPDHGYPIRMIIPGSVGARCVKWLTHITISDKESSSQNHTKENRLYPSNIDFAQENSMIKHSEYILYEMNINSCITHPSHDEHISTGATVIEPHKQYELRGYAFSGGGRPVVRVEVSLDEGKTWLQSNLTFPHPTPPDMNKKPEDEQQSNQENDKKKSVEQQKSNQEKDKKLSDDNKSNQDNEKKKSEKDQKSNQDNDKNSESIPFSPSMYTNSCWTWCHWSCSVTTWQLCTSQSILVRAWDSAGNTQPKEMSWNLLGLYNNCWYRVKLYQTISTKGIPRVKAVHPVVPGGKEGGWMIDQNPVNVPQLLHNPGLTDRPLPGMIWNGLKSGRLFSYQQVIQHDNEDSCWIIMNRMIYDVTPYLTTHPGGRYSLLIQSKLHNDAGTLFHSIHGADAHEITPRFLIGQLVFFDPTILYEQMEHTHKQLVLLRPDRWIKFRLIKRTVVSHDSYTFTFATSDPKIRPHSYKQMLLSMHEELQRVDHHHVSMEPQRAYHYEQELPEIQKSPSHQPPNNNNHNNNNKTHQDYDQDIQLGLHAGQHLLIGAKINNKFVVRPYTPIRPCFDRDWGLMEEEPPQLTSEQSPKSKPTSDKSPSSPKQQQQQQQQQSSQSTSTEKPQSKQDSKPEQNQTSSSQQQSPKQSSKEQSKPMDKQESQSEKQSEQQSNQSSSPRAPRAPQKGLQQQQQQENKPHPSDQKSQQVSDMDKVSDYSTFELLVKIYRDSPSRPGGVMSQFMERMKLNDTISVKGPTGHVLYHGQGLFSVYGISIRATQISLICGGTGLTPIYQLIRHIIKVKGKHQDDTKLRLVYANTTPHDTLLRKQIEKMKCENLEIWMTASHVEDKDKKDWPYDQGQINMEMFEKHLFQPGCGTLAFTCGPPPMMDAAAHLLKEMGYDHSAIIEF